MGILDHESWFVADAMSVEDIREYQNQRLRILLHDRGRLSPFYRRKFAEAGIDPGTVNTVADLQRLPFTEKRELRGEPWALATVPADQIAQTHVSTGTTGGELIYTHFTLEDLYRNEVCAHMPHLLPLEPCDILINALPYEMSVSGHAFHRSLQLTAQPLVMPAGKGGVYSEPERTLKVASELGATAIMTTPTYAAYLAEEARRLRLQSAIDLRLLLLTGEGCSETFRARLETAWSCEARRYYGSLECGLVGAECGWKGGFHQVDWAGVIEVVEPASDRPCARGELGEVVVTTLSRTGSPLFRFRSGDLAYVEPENCVCGIASPRMQLRGRVMDEIPVGDRTWSVVLLEELLLQVEGTTPWYQVVLADRGLRLVLEPDPALSAGRLRRLATEVRARVEPILQTDVKVEFGALPRPIGKYQRVVSAGSFSGGSAVVASE